VGRENGFDVGPAGAKTRETPYMSEGGWGEAAGGLVFNAGGDKKTKISRLWKSSPSWCGVSKNQQETGRRGILYNPLQ